MPKATTLTETNLIAEKINPTEAFSSTNINGITKTNDEWCKALTDAKLFGERVKELQRLRDKYIDMYDNEVEMRYKLGQENTQLVKYNAGLRGLTAHTHEQKEWLEKVNERRQKENANLQRRLDQTLEKVEKLLEENRQLRANYDHAMDKLLEKDSK